MRNLKSHQTFDPIQETISDAKNKAMRDRIRYTKFLEIAEKFAISHELIVGGIRATQLLLSLPPDIDSYRYDFYSNAPLEHARSLATELYESDPQGLGHYVSVLTKIPQYLFTISVDGRELFTITSLTEHKGVRIADILLPTYKPPQFLISHKKLGCFGPELQLLNIYASLCNPAKASEWNELLKMEQNLRIIFEREIVAKIGKAIGGKKNTRNPACPPQIFYILFDLFVASPHRVLLGKVGIDLLLHGYKQARKSMLEEEHLQVASTRPVGEELKELTSLLKKFQNDIVFESDLANPKIPTDSRLRRLTFYAGKNRKPILDIFTTGCYELIPFILKGTIRVGTPFVLMRFRLIDVWIMQLIFRIKTRTPGWRTHSKTVYIYQVLRQMLRDFRDASSYYEKIIAEKASPEVLTSLLFPPGRYIGQAVDLDLALRREQAKKKRFYSPFFPAKKYD